MIWIIVQKDFYRFFVFCNNKYLECVCIKLYYAPEYLFEKFYPANLFKQHLKPCTYWINNVWSFKLFLWCKKNSKENAAIVTNLFQFTNFLNKYR